MKKYKLKKWVIEFIVIFMLALFMFIALCLYCERIEKITNWDRVFYVLGE